MFTKSVRRAASFVSLALPPAASRPCLARTYTRDTSRNIRVYAIYVWPIVPGKLNKLGKLCGEFAGGVELNVYSKQIDKAPGTNGAKRLFINGPLPPGGALPVCGLKWP
ncbi:hypothetical protein GWI33_004978 [Rhynchophorus ferrugineus]|uniref:Uncharacterized protein n=1 Tax=Rhynchophorus ferrugineus TaxID=354439 RepID=A0A834II45_RHYFE|nr:hypothetical protein GWI33_004978 [Rhynchophorus ferrugineus]